MFSGTGIAPMRLIIERRVEMNAMGNYLFFGCRSKAKDFLFEDDWKRLEEDHKGIQLFVAFSRDQPSKVYVQHLMIQNQGLIFDLLHYQKAYVYVSGYSKRIFVYLP
jgi:sulfite reductase alpha subunit-like flavoprotein